MKKFVFLTERRVAVVCGDDIDFDFEQSDESVFALKKEEAQEKLSKTFASHHDSIIAFRGEYEEDI